MKRANRVAWLLLATGIPPVIFTVAVFVLGSIPQSVAPFLTIALVAAPMSIFLPLFAFAGFRHAIMTGRQRLEKQIPTSCFICGEPLPKASLGQVGRVQGPHYARVHPDFWILRKERIRMMLVVLFAFVILWGLVGYGFVFGNYPLSLIGGGLSAVLTLAWIWFDHRRLKSFRTRRQTAVA